MRLYCFPPSPNSRKVFAAAAHLGLAVEPVMVDLTKGDQRKPDYLKINPNGRTPTLVDGDFVLWESEAIMEYLASKKPGNALWPDDPRTRADITRWQCWQLAHWTPATGAFIFENLVKGLLNMGPPDPAALKKGEESFTALAGVLDAHLANRDYLVGKSLTLADFSVAANLALAQPAKIPVDKYKNIMRWYGRIAATEAWKKTEPKMG